MTITDNKFTMPENAVEVKAVFEAVPYSVNVTKNGTGTVSASASTAVMGTEITLNATEDDENHFVRWEVTFGSVSISNVNSKTATFTMPASKVTVTPTFIQAATIADGLYINMPKEGTITTNISTGVKSFKVYDNGGKDGQYENGHGNKKECGR